MKKLATFLSLLAIVLSTFAFGNANFASATNSTPSPTPSCGTFVYTFSSDSNNGRVDVNFESSDQQIDITGVNGWTVTLVELDVENDNQSGYYTYGTGNLNNFNPNPGNDIESARVTVTKSCATSSPTATATPTATPSNVTICHATGSAQNPYNTLHVSSNAISGHFENNGTPKDGHEDDLLLQGTVECPGGSTPTASPTATATASATPTATPSETVVPTPTATPTPLVCTGTQHLNADGSRCVDFELGGGPSNGGSAQGQVLGASTMAGTGNFAETLYQAIMGLGAIFTAKGLKKSKKASK